MSLGHDAQETWQHGTECATLRGTVTTCIGHKRAALCVATDTDSTTAGDRQCACVCLSSKLSSMPLAPCIHATYRGR